MDPIDKLMYRISETIAPLFYKTKHTPNLITTYSFIVRLVALFYLFKNQLTIFALLWAIGYMLDCLDGHFARKYNMSSDFGSIYDHVSDFICNTVLIIIVTLKLRTINQKIFFLVLVFVVFLISSIYNACLREQRGDTDVFSNILKVCYFDNKYIGCGIANLTILILVVIFLHISLKSKTGLRNLKK